MKRVYESPEMEIVQFVAKENVAAGYEEIPEDKENISGYPNNWPQ